VSVLADPFTELDIEKDVVRGLEICNDDNQIEDELSDEDVRFRVTNLTQS